MIVLTLLFALSSGADADVVVRWNEVAYEIGYGEDQFRTFKALHALAMMHLAMDDAVTEVPPGHRSAAAAQAAHDILAAWYPATKGRLDAELARWTPAKHGVEAGRRSAAKVLAAREGDGWDAAGTYTFRSGPGAYQTTPDWNGFVLQPGFRSAKPFFPSRGDQFRPAPPPPLESPEYARAFDEVKTTGSRESAQRSADQSAYAIWWMEFAEGSVNRLARHLAREKRLPLARATRLFALLNMSLFDAYIATWDAKYRYDHWRPYTAIRNAAADGNPRTEQDATWESLRPAPPFPEYTSAHAAGCASAFRVLEEFFGASTEFDMETLTAPPGMKSRRFPSFRAAAAECADSRVRLGWHFRYATDAGLTLGRAVAEHGIGTYRKPPKN